MKHLILIITICAFGQTFGQKLVAIDYGYVFDKAEYHFDATSDEGLDDDQAYVHSGLFLTWLVNNNLVSDFFIEESGDMITELKNRNISPSQIFINWDGTLIGELMNKVGYNFAKHYFDFENGQYLADYEATLCHDCPSLYHIKDSWANYDKLKVVIDKAYNAWSKN